jgi:nickel/cobalt transporter (NicO) family protein
MFQIFAGSLLLSLLHASIPSHWLPIIAIGRSERWSHYDALTITTISGLAHTLSTVLIGVTVGFIGHELSSDYEFITGIVAPVLLITLGLFYTYNDFLKNRVHDHAVRQGSINRRSKWTIAVTLSIAMFFSPCLEIEAFYFRAGTLGWTAIAVVSMIYVVVTVAGMLLLVDLGLKGITRMRSHFLEHHERLVSGLVLIMLGITAFFVEL